MTFAVDIPCVLSVFIYDLPSEDMKEINNLFFFSFELFLAGGVSKCVHMGMIGCIIRILSD